jgi:hypothetical protein
VRYAPVAFLFGSEKAGRLISYAKGYDFVVRLRE